MFAAPLAKARTPRSGPGGHARVKHRGHQPARPREGAASWSFGAIAVLQPKLAVGAANDPLEHEADRAAEQVMRMPEANALFSAAPPRISRKCASCEEEKARTKPAGSDRRGGQEAPGIVHEVLQAPGRPLDRASRAFFEPRFGHDFSRVRVHADPRAAASAGAIGAAAYAMGPNIVFAAGQYEPGSERGQRLLAHELTHVVQQGQGGPAGPIGISRHAPVSLQRQEEAAAAGAPAADSRPLTAQERSVAAFVFGTALNLDPIVIKESAAMAAGGYVRTLPDTIYVAPGTMNSISTGLLIHELTHCAQYQHGVSRVVTAAHAIYAHYDYGGEQGLRDAITARKCFDHFNTEQQADIVQDYYLRVASGDVTYPWSVFIDQVRAQGACIWPTQGRPVPDQPPAGSGVG